MRSKHNHRVSWEQAALYRPVDVTRLSPEHQAARLMHSVDKLLRQFTAAIRRGDNAKATKLIGMLADKQARLQKIDPSYVLDLAPKSASAYVGRSKEHVIPSYAKRWSR